MTALQLRDYILTQIPAEEALLRLLEGSLIEYQKLKFSDEGKEIHPVILISMAAMDMGWQFAIEKERDNEPVRGLVVGTEEYMSKIFKHEQDKTQEVEEKPKQGAQERQPKVSSRWRRSEDYVDRPQEDETLREGTGESKV